MDITETLRQILPCDTQKPYIFISYSSHDKELVWQDVLQYQRMGYNVWLDEKNLDKTKASWKDDALTAVEDLYCMLMVFYVSKSSLLSEACYNELSKTTDEITAALHYGPVKFIAVDVDDIGDIADFTRTLHQSVVQDDSITKESKSKMLITLHNFMTDFFDTNNEKVRVHPKNEVNRKMNYYEEIVAAFPDEAKVYEPVDEESERKKAEEEALLKAETEAREKSEAEARLKAETEAREKAEAEARLLKERMAELEAAAKAAEDSRAAAEAETIAEPASDDPAYYDEDPDEDEFMDDDDFEMLVSAAFGEVKKIESEPAPTILPAHIIGAIAKANDTQDYNFKHIIRKDKCGSKKLKNALKSYAKTVKEEDVIGLWDATLFGSAKEGYIITKDGVYADTFNGRVLKFAGITSYGITSKSHLQVKYKNGAPETFFVPASYSEVITAFLDALLGSGK